MTVEPTPEPNAEEFDETAAREVARLAAAARVNEAEAELMAAEGAVEAWKLRLKAARDVLARVEPQ